jgi:hypothetical protein
MQPMTGIICPHPRQNGTPSVRTCTANPKQPELIAVPRSFLRENEAALRARPVPTIAREYYEGSDMYMFDAFHTTGSKKRRPRLVSLYEVFECIRDDEVSYPFSPRASANRSVRCPVRHN